jgi:uncharacterized membrane protein HdeD (DUF308 family)
MEKKSDMTKTTQPSGWVRALRVVVGLIAIAASIFVLASPGLGLVTLLFILSFSLIFLGIARIAGSVDAKLWSKSHRALHAVAGVLALILGFVVLAFPVLGFGTLIFLLAFAMLIYGIASLLIGGSMAAGLLPKWERALLVIVGVLSVIFALIVIGFPAIALVTLVVMLSVSFLLNGVESIISGIEGKA